MQNPPKAASSLQDPPVLVESPQPLDPQRQESVGSQGGSSTDSNNPVHPALRPNITNVPVTPGINLSTYKPHIPIRNPSNYFSSNLNTLPEDMPGSAADSPSQALNGANSGHEILRRMSLAGSTDRRDSIASIDALAANPELALSGSVISATFCLPHSIRYRKGADWVSKPWTNLDTNAKICRIFLGAVELQLYSTPLPI